MKCWCPAKHVRNPSANVVAAGVIRTENRESLQSPASLVEVFWVQVEAVCFFSGSLTASFSDWLTGGRPSLPYPFPPRIPPVAGRR